VVLATVQDALSSLCTQAKSLLPVTAMLMLIMGGVIYAAGQLLGAETRSRANVWATACLTGALIAILIVVVAPPVLQMMLGDQGTIGCEPQ
jgi:Na+-driven multidrug efflux pump